MYNGYHQCVANAIAIRETHGPAAVDYYWHTAMCKLQRNAVDRWLMYCRPALVVRFGQGPQLWRFRGIVEMLYREHQKRNKGGGDSIAIPGFYPDACHSA